MTRPLAPQHGRAPVVGRDPHEPHRVANTLELLYDLTFVVAFSVAGSNLAHQLAERHFQTALAGFAIAMFAVCWAWINFTWFASAFDNDDWKYRTLTMVQMVGVLLVALGIDPLFASLVAGGDVDNRTMVIGYVVMRVGLVAQWRRVARHDPVHRPAADRYVAATLAAQAGWVVVALLDTSLATFLVAAAVLMVIEMAGPVVAERRQHTPWHAHHVAERYGLLLIITLGEVVLGTVAALQAVIEAQGWTASVAAVGLAGVAITWGLWWVYFLVPSGEALHRHRSRAWVWGYGHMLLFAAVAAVGAGLHVGALYLEHHADLGPTATVATTAVPLGVALLGVYGGYSYVMHDVDPFHVWLVVGTAAVIALAVVLAGTGVGVEWCLVVLAVAPLVTIVGYERRGHDHLDQVLARDD